MVKLSCKKTSSEIEESSPSLSIKIYDQLTRFKIIDFRDNDLGPKPLEKPMIAKLLINLIRVVLYKHVEKRGTYLCICW